MSTYSVVHELGCSFPVKCRFVYAISANIFGKADGGGLARQRKQTDISQESYSPGSEGTHILARFRKSAAAAICARDVDGEGK